MILMVGECIVTLTKRDFLSLQLVQDWLWIEGRRSRVDPAAERPP
jgi:hypothetical protein